jgi:DNA-binding protein WhiA
MSFASEVREELCRVIPEHRCCRAAECYGILLYCNTFTKDEIKIVTENRSFAELLPRLFHRTFGLDFDQFPSLEQPGKLTFIIDDPDKLRFIFSVYGQEHDTLALHVNFGILEEDCCRQSFMRGAFLAGGSVTDPDKRYHLELVTSHLKVSSETYTLLMELGFSPKDALRGGSSILYFKQSDMIVDFLTAIGAPVSAMKIIEAKMEKELRNGVNRRCNCDTANLGKAVDAAQQQLLAIRHLRASGKLDRLPEKLQQAATLREDNPEATLSELAELVEPPISKPAMSHRMRKLIELSEEG